MRARPAHKYAAAIQQVLTEADRPITSTLIYKRGQAALEGATFDDVMAAIERLVDAGDVARTVENRTPYFTWVGPRAAQAPAAPAAPQTRPAGSSDALTKAFDRLTDPADVAAAAAARAARVIPQNPATLPPTPAARGVDVDQVAAAMGQLLQVYNESRGWRERVDQARRDVDAAEALALEEIARRDALQAQYNTLSTAHGIQSGQLAQLEALVADLRANLASRNQQIDALKIDLQRQGAQLDQARLQLGMRHVHGGNDDK